MLNVLLFIMGSLYGFICAFYWLYRCGLLRVKNKTFNKFKKYLTPKKEKNNIEEEVYYDLLYGF